MKFVELLQRQAILINEMQNHVAEMKKITERIGAQK